MKKIIYLILIACAVYAGWIPGTATTGDIEDGIADTLGQENFILKPDCLIVRSHVDLDSFPKIRYPFAKYYRSWEYTLTAADTLIPVPVYTVSGTSNTYHFTPVETGRGDTMIHVSRDMIVRMSVNGNLNWGVNSDETAVLSIGKLSNGSPDTTWSKCGDWGETSTKTLDNQEPVRMMGDLICTAGDTLGLFFKVSDTNITLKDNPLTKAESSVTINLEYIREP